MLPEPVWTRRAEADLLRLHARLEEFHERSGDDLVRFIDTGLRLLRAMPRMAPRYTGPYRRLVLRNPKYGLFYTIEARGIIVQAVCDLVQFKRYILRHLELSLQCHRPRV